MKVVIFSTSALALPSPTSAWSGALSMILDVWSSIGSVPSSSTAAPAWSASPWPCESATLFRWHEKTVLTTRGFCLHSRTYIVFQKNKKVALALCLGVMAQLASAMTVGVMDVQVSLSGCPTASMPCALTCTSHMHLTPGEWSGRRRWLLYQEHVPLRRHQSTQCIFGESAQAKRSQEPTLTRRDSPACTGNELYTGLRDDCLLLLATLEVLPRQSGADEDQRGECRGEGRQAKGTH